MKGLLGGLFHARVPLLAAAAIAMLSWRARVPTSVVAAAMMGLFDLNPLDPRWFVAKTFVTMLVTSLALGAAMVAVYQTAFVILLPGSDRTWFVVGLRIAVCVAAVPAVLAMVRLTVANSSDPRASLVTTVAAMVVAALVVFVAVHVCASEADSAVVRPVLQWVYGWIGPEVRPVDLSHHVWAARFLLLSLVLWAGVLAWTLAPGLHPWVRVPALCSFFILLMILTWFLAALTFVADYYEFPVLSMILIIAVMFGTADHFFATRPAAEEPGALGPRTVVRRRPESRDTPIVAIASAGGGIQAAGWTATVLEGLLHATAAGSERNVAELVRRIAVVSGVSGGSVGLAPFAWAAASGADYKALISALASASDSSLDSLAAAWVTVDLVSGVVPTALIAGASSGPNRRSQAVPGRSTLADRGWALEQSWESAWRTAGLTGDMTLANLAVAARNGDAPAVMFNATNVTTGERLIAGTTVPKTDTPEGGGGFLHAAVLTRDPDTDEVRLGYSPDPYAADMPIATAARLSSSFPVITPASRSPGPNDERQYVIDGAYLDNFGTASLVEWIEHLFAGTPADNTPWGGKILIVQIVSFPEDAKSAETAAPSQFQVPYLALTRVRGPGQGRRAAIDLQRLMSLYPGRVEVFRFVYGGTTLRDGSKPPLSWHLTSTQKADLRHEWERAPLQREATRFLAALHLGDGR